MSRTTSNDSAKTLIIGLSGPSSSGKTTLARLLRQVFNVRPSVLKLIIIHEDDFYKTDKLIPRKTFSSPEFGTRELDDWDCVESLDLPLLERVLGHVKETGRLPRDFASKEDQNTVGESGVGEQQIQAVQRQTEKWLQEVLPQASDSKSAKVTIYLVDGFLLYPDPSSVDGTQDKELYDILQPLLSSKVFLPSSREHTIDRRTKRTGYVTLEGFWEDPPGYVEDVVWPNYGRDHAWLFISPDAHDEASVLKAIDEGRVHRETAAENQVHVGPGTGEALLTEILPWSVERVKEMVETEIQS